MTLKIKEIKVWDTYHTCRVTVEVITQYKHFDPEGSGCILDSELEFDLLMPESDARLYNVGDQFILKKLSIEEGNL